MYGPTANVKIDGYEGGRLDKINSVKNQINTDYPYKEILERGTTPTNTNISTAILFAKKD